MISFCFLAFFVKSQEQPTNPIVLGNQLTNPYTVSAMQAAKISLKAKKPNLSYNLLSNIETTHYYIKYKPVNDAEFELLRSDSTLELFEYPLDYEILNGDGTWYHEPSLANGAITWQYCVIEKNEPIKPIAYEVLADLFLPEPFIELQGVDPLLEAVSLELIDEALLNSGNLFLGEFGARASKWTPSGTITAYDDLVGAQIPIAGAKVRVRSWFKYKKVFTNSNGYFSTDDFRTKVNYTIVWERFRYDIRNGWSLQSHYKGPKGTKNNWNPAISSGKSLRHATIHRAAYRYFYGNIGGLKRPNVWTKLKINYVDKSGANQGINWGNHWQLFVAGPILPHIKIWKNTGGSDFDTQEIFATTVHEIGHTSHIQLMNMVAQFGQVDILLRESWANAIEWHVTDIEYVSIGYGVVSKLAIQGWNSSNSHEYTPLFIDFVDTQNQGINVLTGQPYCDIGYMDGGGNCQIGQAPSGETAFIYAANGNKYFYYTPVGSNGCPVHNAWFDGSNCLVMTVPAGRLPFIHLNHWYLNPVIGTITTRISNKPDDQISGFVMSTIESQIVKHSYGLSSLQTRLKSNKPSGVTNAQIDTYLNFYFNL